MKNFLHLFFILCLILTGCNENNDSREPTRQAGINKSTSNNSVLAKYVVVATAQEKTASLNATVLLDGKPVGVVDASGRFKGETSAGNHIITVSDKLYGMARQEITLQAGSNPVVQIEIAAGSEETEPLSLKIEGAEGGILRGSPSVLRVSLQNVQGTAVSLVSVNAYLSGKSGGVDLVDDSGGRLASGGTVFEVQSFSAALASLANSSGEITITIDGEDSSGISYSGTVTFRLGNRTVTGQLQVPPSTPGLVLANRTIQLALLGTETTESAITNGSGAFQFENISPGLYDVKMSFIEGGLEYSTFGTITIENDSILSVTPLTGSDYENGVESVTVTSSASARGKLALKPRREAMEMQANSPVRAKSFGNNTVSVSASAENTPVKASKSYTIPKGAKTATLRYRVSTAEYPKYVLSNSEFNDKWSVAAVVSTTGKQLFAIARRINSQVSTPPTWTSAGDTGDIEVTLNVESLTVSAPIDIVVALQSTNIGDDILPTTVMAEITPPSVLKVQSLRLITPSFVSDQTSDVLSIPDAGKSGVKVKKAIVSITDSAGNPVKPSSAKLELVSANGSSLGELPAPTFSPSGAQFQFPVTLGNKLNGANSPEYGLLKLTVKATVAGESVEGEGESALLLLLRTMPEGTLTRTGGRDVGGDEWSRLQTVTWMQGNAASLTRFDDISGEHGRNIGHQTHMRGTDIDMLQFGVSSGSGTEAYLALLKNVRIAIDKTKSKEIRDVAIQSIGAYFTAQRNGISTLLGLANVAHVITLDDNNEPDLADHWGKIAFKEGVLTRANGTTVDLGIGEFTPSGEVRHLSKHHHHNHVTLSF